MPGLNPRTSRSSRSRESLTSRNATAKLISNRSNRNYPQKYSSSSCWTWNLFFKQSLLYLRPSFWSNLESLEMHEIRSDQCLFTSAAAWTKNLSIKIFVNNFFFVFAMLSLPAVGVANMYYNWNKPRPLRAQALCHGCRKWTEMSPKLKS